MSTGSDQFPYDPINTNYPYEPEQYPGGGTYTPENPGGPLPTGGTYPVGSNPWQDPMGPTNPNPTNGGGGAGSGGGNWWDGIVNTVTGGGGNGGWDATTLAMLGPALASAYKQWGDAGKYRDSAQAAITAGQPYRDRDMYSDRLKSMTEDPNAYLANSPDYQAALKQGIGGVERSQAAKGYLGSGNMLAAISDYSADTAAKYLDRDRQSLMALAKGDPNAGSYIMQGDRNAIDSENNALAALFSPFGMSTGNNRINNNTTPGGGGGGNSPFTPQNVGNGLDQLLKTSISSGSGNAVVQGLQRAMQAGGATAAAARQWAIQNGFMIPNGPPLEHMPETPGYNELDPENPNLFPPEEFYIPEIGFDPSIEWDNTDPGYGSWFEE